MEEQIIDRYWYQNPWVTRILIFDAIVGLIAFEWSWQRMSRYRNLPPEIRKLFPEFRRNDCLKWSRLNFMPGAAFLFFPRLCMMAFCFIMCCSMLWLALLGHDMNKPLTGIR
jgi:hypothetical protein